MNISLGGNYSKSFLIDFNSMKLELLSDPAFKFMTPIKLYELFYL
jgi:hypothetical protein